MKTFSWLWSAPVLALVLAGPAHAGILATPVTGTVALPADVQCTGGNVGESPIASLTARLVPTPQSVALFGSAVVEETCVNVAPGDICGASIAVPAGNGFAGHCKVIFTGSKKNVRGSIFIGGFGNVVQELPAE